jgi:hypothetical protein
MKQKTDFERLRNLWERMQTSRKPEIIASKAIAIVNNHMLKNDSISPEMWPLIDFFQHADMVLKSKNNQQTEVNQ